MTCVGGKSSITKTEQGVRKEEPNTEISVAITRRVGHDPSPMDPVLSRETMDFQVTPGSIMEPSTKELEDT